MLEKTHHSYYLSKKVLLSLAAVSFLSSDAKADSASLLDGKTLRYLYIDSDKTSTQTINNEHLVYINKRIQSQNNPAVQFPSNAYSYLLINKGTLIGGANTTSLELGNNKKAGATLEHFYNLGLIGNAHSKYGVSAWASNGDKKSSITNFINAGTIHTNGGEAVFFKNAHIDTLKNQGIIQSDKANGMIIAEGASVENFINEGVIQTQNHQNVKNGSKPAIQIRAASITHFTNLGIIGSAHSKYGMAAWSSSPANKSSITNFINAGTIHTNGGEAVFFKNAHIDTLKNQGIIQSNQSDGMLIAENAHIENFINEGLIQTQSKQATGTNAKAAIRIRGASIAKFSNNGFIYAPQTKGILNLSTIENLDNNGFISSMTNKGFIDSLNNANILVNLNNNANINTLNNEGLLQSLTNEGLITSFNNAALSGNITNKGKILADFNNTGILASLDNKGTLVKGFSNNGLITSSIDNAGISASIINKGIIMGSITNSAVLEGFNNLGTLNNIINTALITQDINNLGLNSGMINKGVIKGGIHNLGVLERLTNEGLVLEDIYNLGLGGSIDNKALMKSFNNITYTNSFTNNAIMKSLNNTGSIENIINRGLIIENIYNLGSSNTLNNNALMNSIINKGFINTFNNTGILASLKNNSRLNTLTNEGLILENIELSGSVDKLVNKAHIQGNIILNPDSKIKEGIFNQDKALIKGNIDLKEKARMKALVNTASIGGDINIAKESSLDLIVNAFNAALGGSIMNQSANNLAIYNAKGSTLAKGIVNEGEGIIKVSNKGFIGKNSDHAHISNKNLNGQVLVKDWLIFTNPSTAKLDPVVVSGAGASNVKFDSLIIDQSDLNLQDLNDISNIIKGVDRANVSSIKLNGGGEISLAYHALDKKITPQFNLNASMAGALFRNLSFINLKRSIFIDTIMSMQSFYLDSKAMQEKTNLYASARNLIQSDFNQATYKKHILFSLPYASSLNLELTLNEESKGYTKGNILAYSTLKESGIYGLYLGYEDSYANSSYFNVRTKSSYAGIKYFNTLLTLTKGNEFYIKAWAKAALNKNDLKKKILFNEAKAHPKSYAYGANVDLGMKLNLAKSIFSPQIAFAYEGDFTQAFSMINTKGKATVHGGERMYKNQYNLFSTKASVTWFEDWLPHLKTSLELGARVNLNPKLKLKARFGNIRLKEQIHLAKLEQLVNAELITMLNKSLYFSLNYNGIFNKNAKAHTGFAQFSYLW